MQTINVSTRRMLVAALLLGNSVAAGCESQTRVPRTVLVEFEMRLVNARGSWACGRTGGEGWGGTSTNDVIKRSAYLSVGEPVGCTVVGEHWDRSDPGHQVLCRITVDGEEIYVCGDQGTRDRDTKAQCGGPVYIPQKKSER